MTERADVLFPVRQTRRDFLAMSAAAGAAAMLPAAVRAEDDKPKAAPVKIGAGKATYTLDESWGKLPKGMTYGYGCAVVVDSKDRIFVTSRSESPCVAIFGADGKLEETWGKSFAEGVGMTTPQVKATAHGLYLAKEGKEEFLYWTENVAGGPRSKFGARVYKTDMKGKVLYTLGPAEKNTETTQKIDLTNPTDVAVAANGDIYVVDGYGSQKVHRFDKNFKLLKTIGGPGKDHGKFNTCHGVWVSTLRKTPEVWIADRANGRLEVYDMELNYVRTLSGYNAPCCFYESNGQMFVPELGSRVSIVDAEDKVVARLGDGKDVKAGDRPKTPAAFATPHALTVDSKGSLYVIEWLPDARVRKFAHTPA